MKTAKLILAFGFILGCAQWASAQVKIGDRPLELGEERLLELERAGELFIVTDSLEIGITNSLVTNVPSVDAMMLKLYGYGLGQFTGSQNYFLGTNTLGEVLEFPLTLDLVTNSTTANLSLFNGTNNFGDVDLTGLDSVFSTNTQLIDSLMMIRTLINEVSADVDSDLDTVQINELIAEIQLEVNAAGDQTILTFFENLDPSIDPADRHTISIELGNVFATDFQLEDTAAVLRDLVFYRSDGSLDEDRTVTGDGHSLDFTGIDSFNVNSSNTTFSSTGNTSISSDGEVSITSTNGNVTIDASTDSIGLIGIVTLDEYPALPIETNFNNILGIDANGNVINVSAGSILGTEEDSVIYNHNGTLRSERTMTMGSFDLRFAGSTDTTVIASDGRVAIGTTSFTPNSTGSNPSDVKLEVNGDILARRVHSSSDKRFKKNIHKIDSALEKVLQLNGVTYDWRVDEFKNRNFSRTKQVGFIAQNVESVLPEVVQTYGDGYKAVDYAKITALLNEAIKEQQVQIKQQAALIRAQQDALSSVLVEVQSLRGMLEDAKRDVPSKCEQTTTE